MQVYVIALLKGVYLVFVRVHLGMKMLMGTTRVPDVLADITRLMQEEIVVFRCLLDIMLV